jgi:dihydrofolate reductase / thymidylate synthase
MLKIIILYYFNMKKFNVNIIVAHCNSGGIGFKNEIPWKIKKDLQYFKDITSDVYKDKSGKNVVIMGRKTYQSIPTKVRPLSNRINVVLSSNSPNLDDKETSDLHYMKSYQEIYDWLNNTKEVNNIYVIGGAQIYNDFLWDDNVKELFNIDMIYITRIRGKYECDKKFPKIPSEFFIEDMTPDFYEHKETHEEIIEEDFEKGECNKNDCYRYYFIRYEKKDKEHDEKKYLNMVSNVLKKHSFRMDRTGEGILSHFGYHMRYDIHKSFPLLTTKRMFWKGIIEELLWFLRGDTNVQNLIDKGVHIWDKNSDREFLDSIGLKNRKEYDGGPIYGFNFRHFGAKYVDCNTDYSGKGVDQVAEVLRLIREEPHSRRILINLWNPCELKNVCLPACHCMYQFYVDGDYLSCSMYQRSGDLGLGVPFNIASASLMTYIFAHLTGKYPKELIHTIGDAHIYKNHIKGVEEQLKREPTPLPRVRIKGRGQTKVEDFTYEDFEVFGYEPRPTIKMDMAV